MNINKIGQKILLFRLKKKDKGSFLKIYNLYADKIYRFIYFKISNPEEAQDLTSEVFLKTWNYAQRNRINEKTLLALIYKIARNIIIDHYRKESTRPQVASVDSLTGESYEIIDEKEDLLKKTDIALGIENIQEKMLELKDEYREAIILRFVEELSISEIADIMGKSKGNVRILVYRALKALRELMVN
jgi:RNA polymerase sigma-70 factor (ECF subfamily)